MSCILRAVGAEKDDSGVERMERVARKAWELAEAGNTTAIQFVFERMDGKVKDRLEVEGKSTMTVVEEVVAIRSDAKE